jgi:DNA recombination protein RmuC
VTILLIVLIIVNALVLLLLFTKKASIDSVGIANTIDKSNSKVEKALREEMSINRAELRQGSKDTRDEISNSLKNFGDSVDKRIEKIRETVGWELKNIQKDNSEKLEQMRQTVDEKLHATLEKRLGESFKLVSDRLELVHKGLGEMQTLASGVGDLKKVLQNVKTRGILGEVQLENLLDQILTVEQYEKNVITKEGSNERVEFAIKIPAKNEKIKYILLPIDAKFPMEDYENLMDAQDKCDPLMIEKFTKSLEAKLKFESRKIKDKYLNPPYTTDFAILYIPIDGLYAEILRRPGLFEQIQREFKVTVTGPTTISAFLSSLQMGFRTLAIEKSTSEVWTILSAVKNEFGKFGDLLDKTHKKLQEASNSIEQASTKSRTIERKLSKVQELPLSDQSTPLLEE